MLIRRRTDIVILGFLLLAGVGSSFAQKNGYAYPRPSVSFSDGIKQQPQYVVSSSTVKPAVAFTGFSQTVQKPQVAFQGLAPQAPKAQSQKPLILPQVNFQATQGVLQGLFRPQVNQPTTSYVQPAAPTTIRPVVAPKPTQSYLPPKSQVSTLSVAKPQIAFQGFAASSTPRPVVAAVKPQASFSGFQGFSQKPAVSATTFNQIGQQYVKPAVTGLYQAPAVASTYRPQVSVAKPQIAFQGFAASSTPRPVVAAVKPQASFSGAQGFSQKPAVSTTTFSQIGQQYVKPAVTGLYQAPAVASTYRPQVSVVKPQASFQGFTASSTPRPVVAAVRPQASFSGSQGFSQKPAVSTTTFSQIGQQYVKPSVTGLYQAPAVASTYRPQVSVVKPQASFQGFTASSTPRPVAAAVKPQASFSGFPGFSQTVQKPAVSTTTFSQIGQQSVKPAAVTGLYQAPAVASTHRPQVSVAKPQASFQGFTASSTPRPVVAAVKPQASFSGFPGFSQTVQKPAVSTTSFSQIGQQYVKPAVTGLYQAPAVASTHRPQVSVAKPQASFQGFTASSTPRPVVAAVKPQASFSGFPGFSQTVQKPAVSTTSFSQIGQQYVKPAVPGLYQAPAVTTTYRPQVSAVKPQASFQGFIASSTPRPVVVTGKPQINVGSFQSLGQSVQRPSTAFNQIVKPSGGFSTFQQTAPLKPATLQIPSLPSQPQLSYLPPKGQAATLTVSKPQVAFQGFSASSTPRPAAASVKPQVGFSGLQGFQSKPAITTFSQVGQQVVKPAAVTGQYQGAVVSTTYRPQVSTVFSAVKPQAVFQGFAGSSIPKPAFVTSKPQVNFGGLQGFSQQSYIQRPAVSTTTLSQFGQQVVKPAAVTGLYQAPVVSTTVRPQVSVASVKPLGGFSGFQGFGQSKPQVSVIKTQPAKGFIQASYQKPQLVQPSYSQAGATQNPSLAYLPPKGQQRSNSQAGFNGLQAPGLSGQYKSFFELASATANQVVDVAQENKVGGFVAKNSFTNQLSTEPLEQQVENVDFKENAQINAIQGQQQDPNLGYTQFGTPAQATVQAQLTVVDRDDQSSIPVTLGNTSDQYQDFDDFDQSESESQFLPEYRTIDNLQVASQLQAQNYQQYNDSPDNLYGFQVLSAQSSNVVNSQIDNDSQVQDPQPLNREEQQVRHLHEQADSDKEDLAIKGLEPGMYAGPHVNSNSDKEYNVFDYDQYSAAPVEAET